MTIGELAVNSARRRYDDASTDGTTQLAESYQPFKCELVRSEENKGLFKNFNRALEFAAECDFLHYICADDVLLPNFMQRMSATLADEPAPSPVVVCVCG